MTRRPALLAVGAFALARMGLRDLPTTWDDWGRLNRDFEAGHFHFHPDNRLVADATVQLLLDREVPRRLHGAARWWSGP